MAYISDESGAFLFLKWAHGWLDRFRPNASFSDPVMERELARLAQTAPHLLADLGVASGAVEGSSRPAGVPPLRG